MASLVIASLTNDSKFKRGLADKFMEKHMVVKMTGSMGLELVNIFLKRIEDCALRYVVRNRHTDFSFLILSFFRSLP